MVSFFEEQEEQDLEMAFEGDGGLLRLAKVAQGDGGWNKLNVGRPTSKVAQGDNGGTYWNPKGPLIATSKGPKKNKACAWMFPHNRLPSSVDVRTRTAR